MYTSSHNAQLGGSLLSPDGKLALSGASVSPTTTVATNSTADSAVFSSPTSSLRMTGPNHSILAHALGCHRSHPLLLPSLLCTPSSPSSAASPPPRAFASSSMSSRVHAPGGTQFSPSQSPYNPSMLDSLLIDTVSVKANPDSTAAHNLLFAQHHPHLLQAQNFGTAHLRPTSTSRTTTSSMPALQSPIFSDSLGPFDRALSPSSLHFLPVVRPSKDKSGGGEWASTLNRALSPATSLSRHSATLPDLFSPAASPEFLTQSTDSALVPSSCVFSTSVSLPNVPPLGDLRPRAVTTDASRSFLNLTDSSSRHGFRSHGTQLPPTSARNLTSPVAFRPSSSDSPPTTEAAVPTSSKRTSVSKHAKCAGGMLSPTSSETTANILCAPELCCRRPDLPYHFNNEASLSSLRHRTTQHPQSPVPIVSPLGPALVTPSSTAAHTALQQRILKTKLCVHHLHGRCARGSDCTFAHSTQELRRPPNLYKTRLCINFANTGSCPKGSQCRFAHGGVELRTGGEGGDGVLNPDCSSSEDTPDELSILDARIAQAAAVFGCPSLERLVIAEAGASAAVTTLGSLGPSTPTACLATSSPRQIDSSSNSINTDKAKTELCPSTRSGSHTDPTVSSERSSEESFSGVESAVVDAFLKVPVQLRPRLLLTLSASVTSEPDVTSRSELASQHTTGTRLSSPYLHAVSRPPHASSRTCCFDSSQFNSTPVDLDGNSELFGDRGLDPFVDQVVADAPPHPGRGKSCVANALYGDGLQPEVDNIGFNNWSLGSALENYVRSQCEDLRASDGAEFRSRAQFEDTWTTTASNFSPDFLPCQNSMPTNVVTTFPNGGGDSTMSPAVPCQPSASTYRSHQPYARFPGKPQTTSSSATECFPQMRGVACGRPNRHPAQSTEDGIKREGPACSPRRCFSDGRPASDGAAGSSIAAKSRPMSPSPSRTTTGATTGTTHQSDVKRQQHCDSEALDARHMRAYQSFLNATASPLGLTPYKTTSKFIFESHVSSDFIHNLLPEATSPVSGALDTSVLHADNLGADEDNNYSPPDPNIDLASLNATEYFRQHFGQDRKSHTQPLPPLVPDSLDTALASAAVCSPTCGPHVQPSVSDRHREFCTDRTDWARVNGADCEAGGLTTTPDVAPHSGYDFLLQALNELRPSSY